jgi:hypothetical protein
MLADQLGIPKVYGGAFMRREAMRAGFAREGYSIPADESVWDLDQANVPSFREQCQETERDIDGEIEVYLLTEMAQAEREQSDLVVESKTMARLLHTPAVDRLLDQAQNGLGSEVPRVYSGQLLQDSKAVWIHADPEVRAARALNKASGRGAPGTLEGCGPNVLDQALLRNEIALLTRRSQVDAGDYSRRYGMSDYPANGEMPNALYGHVIDNSCHTGCDQTFGEVLTALGL